MLDCWVAGTGAGAGAGYDFSAFSTVFVVLLLSSVITLWPLLLLGVSPLLVLLLLLAFFVSFCCGYCAMVVVSVFPRWDYRLSHF